MSAEEMNIAVREYLRAHPSATRDEISEKLGISTGSVSKTPSWITVSGKRREMKGKSKPHGMKKIGLDIADEKQAEAKFEEKKRAEEEELRKTIAEQEAERLAYERPHRRCGDRG